MDNQAPATPVTYQFGQPVEVYRSSSATWVPGFIINGRPDADGELYVALADNGRQRQPDTGYARPDHVRPVAVTAPELAGALAKENAELLRRNGNQRVEIENQDARIDELQRQLAAVAEAKPTAMVMPPPHLELHTTAWVRMLESKAQAYDDLVARLAQARDRSPELPPAVRTAMWAIRAALDSDRSWDLERRIRPLVDMLDPPAPDPVNEVYAASDVEIPIAGIVTDNGTVIASGKGGLDNSPGLHDPDKPY